MYERMMIGYGPVRAPWRGFEGSCRGTYLFRGIDKLGKPIVQPVVLDRNGILFVGHAQYAPPVIP
jgi:hypothetical protein